ncbi:hypothetical protein [Streptosporangium sp. OZ121]|uniref:hypothetical protein n=1 Tax=Streptosporangium sp. OZ121 TaxID=3444183 RepID=UPI003F7A9584
MRSFTFAIPGDDELTDYLRAIKPDDHNHPYAPAATLWPRYREQGNAAEQALTWADNDEYRWVEQNDRGAW